MFLRDYLQNNQRRPPREKKLSEKTKDDDEILISEKEISHNFIVFCLARCCCWKQNWIMPCTDSKELKRNDKKFKSFYF